MTWCSGIHGQGNWRCVNISEKGGEVPGSLHQPSFLKHPSCCWLGCAPRVKVESTSPFLRAWISCFTLFMPDFLPKHLWDRGKIINPPCFAGF